MKFCPFLLAGAFASMSSGMIDINAKYLSELIDLSHCSYQCALYAEGQCSLRGHWPEDEKHITNQLSGR